MAPPVLIGGDIGGTHIRLRVVEYVDGGCRVLHDARRASADYATLADGLADGLAPLPDDTRARLAGACLAVAGRVHNGRMQFTNRPWRISEQGLAAALGLPWVVLVNDLEAFAVGVGHTADDQLIPIRDGHMAGPRRLVVTAGTGLGVACAVAHADRWQAFATEGGHMDFAPADETQIELLRWLRRRHDHVSAERVLSGDGLCSLYEFVCARRAAAPVLFATSRRTDAVTAAAAAGDADARAAVELFANLLGAFLGSTALLWLADGIYLAGGVLSALDDALRRPGFEQAFTAKGRMRALLEDVPVWRVEAEDAGLSGALTLARASWQRRRAI